MTLDLPALAKLPVIFFDQYAHLQGGQRVLVEAVTAAREAGYPVAVAFPFGGSLEEVLRRLAVLHGEIALVPLPLPQMRSGRKSWRDLLVLLRLLAPLWRLRQQMAAADWLYLNGPRLYLPVTLLSLGLRRSRRLLHVHLCHTVWQQRLIRLLARLPRTEAVVVPSPFVAERLQAVGMRVIANALSSAFVNLPFREQGRGAVLNVAVIGVVRPEKGHGRLMQAAQMVGDVQVHVFGGVTPEHSAYAEQLQARFADVVWHGVVADVPAALAAAAIDLVVMPSAVPESFGLAAIEAAACSCAVAVSAHGALPAIAATLGATVFADDAELRNCLRLAQSATDDDFRAMRYQQWSAAQAHFQPARFRAQLQAVLSGADCVRMPG